MKKKKHSFPKRQNYVTKLNSSSIGEFAASNNEHSMDSTNELSAYEVLLHKKGAIDDIESSLSKGKMMPNLTGKTEDCKSFTKRETNKLASNFLSGSVREYGDELDEIYETEKKERKLTRGEIRKGIKRKLKTGKSVDKGGLNDSTKMRRQTHSNGSVFSSLFRKGDSLEEMPDSLEQNTCDKAPQNSKKKKKRKIQKKVQKIICGGKTIDYIMGEGEEAAEIGERKNMKNGKGQDKEFELYDDLSACSSFLNDEEEGTANDMVHENFVKCYGIEENENVQGVVIDFEQKPFSSHCDSVQNGLDAFQWLIDSYDIAQFFKTVFQKEVFCICRNNPNYYGNLFSTAKFIDILRTNYVEYGTNVNVAVYKNQQRRTLNGSGRVYPQEIQKNIKAGCSIQFTNPQSFCDNVWYYCDLLQEVFGCFVGANTYITPKNTAGFAPHWDDIDAFLLQLEGRKHWKIYAPIDDNEMLPRLPSGNFTDDDLANRTPVFNDWLEQGDMVYIPRGFIHQGFADKDVHSLHLTVSVCRNVAYADLLEHIIPAALSNFADQHVSIRKSLPAGYLDMTGVLKCNYPLFKTGTMKLHRFLDSMFSNFCKYIKELNEPAIDMMAREFMKTALPPVLTEEEKDMTALCVAGSSLYDDNEHVFTKDVPIKLLRRHGQRLIYESEECCFIIHRMANSRVYEGRPEVLFDLDVELAEGFANLLDVYPHWCLVSDLKCNTVTDSIRLAKLLYSNGLLMAKFPNIMD
ncbi:unnamed protein product [Cercopithifilaria johnstoni]|uniref:Bifunctional lysine-specific demethylase and histidyl-hydroxylase n=1 Tax=Cercopithifilaria johnstoni TaxID=2874296 RepID=A0A8J2LYS6_9BILA|nr:unnamed protein product [Cercopithifilaria johnstoni]